MAGAVRRSAGDPGGRCSDIAGRRPRRVALLVTTLLLLAGCADGSHVAEPALLPPTLSVPDPSDHPASGLAATSTPGEATAPATEAAEAEGVADADGGEARTLTPDFPADLLPVPVDGAILVASVVPVGDAQVQEISLNVRTSLEAAEALELYRTALVERGFTEVPPASSPDALTAESLFTRSAGDELVSVGVLDADGARTVTVGGRIRTSE